MALLGPDGLARVASACHANLNRLASALADVEGAQPVFSGVGFHELVIKLDQPAAAVLAAMTAEGVLGGFDLGRHYPELGEAILVCVTETKTDADIEQFVTSLRTALASV